MDLDLDLKTNLNPDQNLDPDFDYHLDFGSKKIGFKPYSNIWKFGYGYYPDLDSHLEDNKTIYVSRKRPGAILSSIVNCSLPGSLRQ